MINKSRYKSGEICKEFVQGCISDDRHEFIRVINKLYQIYAKVCPKIRELLLMLMRNKNKIAHAYLHEFKFVKDHFYEKARTICNIIKRAPFRRQTYKSLPEVLQNIWN